MIAVTTFSDIAGQITESAIRADKLTAASICMPDGTMKSVRTSIPAAFPKWRNATDADLEFLVDLLMRESWSICAASLDKSTPAWTAFWKDSRQVHSKTASIIGGSITFLKAATLVKLLLFGQVSTMAVAHAVKAGTLPMIVDHNGQLHITESAVFDNEIHGDENRDAMTEAWVAMNADQPQINSIGIHRKVTSISLLSEKSEPMLLLPDYVAGIVQAENSKVNTLSHSSISQEALRRAAGKLRASPKFLETETAVPNSYFDIFPDLRAYAGGDAA